MAKQIVSIPLKKLAIDKYNIRGGKWISDSDLIDSIKKIGILEPLIVRTAPKNSKIDYTVVCGSRRYFASGEAQLKEVPCIVKELTDAEALGLSITENKDRKDIPVWRYVERIKEYFTKINGHLSKEERIKIAQNELNLSKGTAYYYIDIIGAPPLILELMKPSDDRSQEVQNLLKKVSGDYDTTKQLSIHIAAKIAAKLQEFSLKKQLEVAVILLGKSESIADELIMQVQKFPNIPAEELYEKKVIKIPMGKSFSFTFGSHIVAGLEKAMIREGLDRKTLVSKMIEDWLKKKGYI